MDYNEKNSKIYSRKRIKLPNFKISENKITSKIIKIIIIITIAVLTAVVILKAINPIIDKLCLSEAKNIATKISNDEATNVMDKYAYNDLVNITKDKNEDVVLVQANTNAINDIASRIPNDVIEKMSKNTNSTITIYLGSIFGLKILSGRGPKISAKIANTGNVETNLVSEFKAQGINQTLHRIYLELKMEVSILTPYDTVSTTITNQVLIAESIIVGAVPNSYYNLNTMNSNDIVRTTEK